MKKVAIISLVAMMAVGFAFEPKFNATLVQGMNLNSGSTYGFVNKSRLVLTAKVSDATSFTYEQSITALGAPIYNFVDTKTALGSFRLGTQLVIPANKYGGVYQNSLYFTKLALIGTAVGYGTQVGGMDLGLAFAGGINSAARTIGAKLGTKLGDNNLSVYGLLVNNAAGTSGAGLGADLNLDLGTIDGYVQAYMDLSDASAPLISLGTTGATQATARQVVAGGLSTDMGGMKVYADLTMGLNAAGKLQLGGIDQSIVGGVVLPVNSDARLDLNVTMSTPTGGSATTTIAGALEVKI